MTQLTVEQRKERNRELELRAKKRLEARGAPFFGAAEKDVLQMRVQLAGLLQTQKSVAENMNLLLKEKEEAKQRLKELNYTVRALLDVLEFKGVITDTEYNERLKKRQLNDLALEEIEGSVEANSLATIKFRLLDGEKVIDDRTKHPMLYEMGTKNIPCEEKLIGLKKGERVIVSNVVFGEGFRIVEYVNRPITMDILICGVHRRKLPEASPSVSTESVTPEVKQEGIEDGEA